MPRLRKEYIIGISILLMVCIAGISARTLSPSRTERDGARVQRVKQDEWNEMESRRRNNSSPGNGNRPGNNGTRPGNNGTRPGNNGTSPGNNGTSPGNNGNRPGNNGTSPGNNGNRPGNNGNRPGNNGTSPGNNGNRPGNNGTSPGNNGTSPGNNGTTPGNNATYPNVTIPEHPPFSPDQERNVTFSPWSKDNKCQKYKVTLGRNLPRMALVSYPRSGSSWTRYLIEGSSGFFTGSVYRDRRLYAFGYLGELESPSDRSCLFYKDHQFRPRVVDDTTPVLFIIRNPRHVFLSFYAFRNSPNASVAFNSSADAELYRRRDFHEKLDDRIRLWEQMASLLIQRCRYLHITYYEYLKEDPIFEVKRILDFLRIPKDKERLKCLKKFIDGYVNRGQPTFDVYTPEEKQKMRGAVNRVSDKLKGKGYPKLPYDDRD